MMEIKKNPLNLNSTTLSIRTIPNGFCFALFERYSKDLLYFAQHDFSSLLNQEDELNQIIHQQPILNHSFDEVFWLVDTEKYFLIPSSIFEQESLSHYWQLNFHPLEENESIQYDIIPTSDIVVIYAIDKRLESLFQKRFPNLQSKHKQSIQISSVLKKYRKNGQQLNLFLYEDCFDTILIENGRLILANSYPAKDVNEFLYFLVNIFEQFRLDQYQTELNIHDSSSNEVWINETKKYISNVLVNKECLAPIDKKFMQSAECIKQITLLNLPLCV